MLVVFSPIFAADTKVISNHDFAVLLMERVIFCVVNVEGMVLSNEIFLYVVKQACHCNTITSDTFFIVHR